MKREALLYTPEHTQSRASLLALKETYPKEWEVWLEYRMRLLTKWEDQRGTLQCEYCGRKNLERVTEGVKKERQATLDHVQPLAKGGAKYDEDNLVVACRPCNERKADKYEVR